MKSFAELLVYASYVFIGVSFVVMFCEIKRCITQTTTLVDYIDSMQSLLGQFEVRPYHHWGADLSINCNQSELPLIKLSFSTFLTLLSADPSKIAICMFRADDNFPGAILYDKNNDGCANARIVMRTRKDARSLIKWFRAMRRAEAREEQERKDRAEYEELVSVTESMQKDITAQHDRQHDGLMRKTMENRKWREDAENRQIQMRGV